MAPMSTHGFLVASFVLAGGVEAGCVEVQVPAEPEFVAIEQDFADFDRWNSFDRGPDPVPPAHPDGRSIVYVNQLPPPGAREFPSGTILVRITTAAERADYEAHAMVKRGGGFNAAGARGWEFFELSLEEGADGGIVPAGRWRGEGPSMGDGYTVPDGGVILSCNHCHASFPESDSVIGDELALTLRAAR
jgi:hypothetical protein